jgi:hypothetical protein
MQDATQIYSKLLELNYPWMVDSVFIDSARKIVEVHVIHDKGAKLPCPECRRECMCYG